MIAFIIHPIIHLNHFFNRNIIQQHTRRSNLKSVIIQCHLYISRLKITTMSHCVCNQLSYAVCRKFIYILSVHSLYCHSHVNFFKNILVCSIHLFLNRTLKLSPINKMCPIGSLEHAALNNRLPYHPSGQKCICIGRIYLSAFLLQNAP